MNWYGKSRYSNGKNCYKWHCIHEMIKMDVGDSITVRDRGKYIIQTTWLWKAVGMSRYIKRAGYKFKIQSVEPNDQVITRVS